jgi:hypothetical protein
MKSSQTTLPTPPPPPPPVNPPLIQKSENRNLIASSLEKQYKNIAHIDGEINNLESDLKASDLDRNEDRTAAVDESLYNSLKETSITEVECVAVERKGSNSSASPKLGTNNDNNNNNNNNNNITDSSDEEVTAAKTETKKEEEDTSNKFLFRVRAQYAYDAKEIDELTFMKGDFIIVVEGSESEREDLDEGWLIGIHEATKRRGLFPENFSVRV